MKRTLCNWSILFMSLLSATPLLAYQRVRLAPNSVETIRLSSAVHDRLVRIRARIELKGGKESWGGYYLAIQKDGQELKGPLVNTGDRLWDIAKVPATCAKQYSTEHKAWFVKADSNWTAYDSTVEGSAYDRTAYLNKNNLGDGRGAYTNAYYDKVFQVGPAQASLQLKNLSSRYVIRCDVETASLPSHRLVFSAPIAGKHIYPWSFPECEEIGKGLQVRTCPGERESAVLALYNLSGQQQQLAWTLADFKDASGNGIPATAADIRIQTFLTGKKTPHHNELLTYASLGGHDILVPERLEARTQWQVAPGKSGALWVIVSVPAAAKPGTYRSALILNKVHRIPLEIDVLPFRLLPTSRTYFLWTNFRLSQNTRQCERQLRDMREHGINSLQMGSYSVPIALDKEGKADLSNFISSIARFKAYGFCRQNKCLLYGLDAKSDPLFTRLKKLAGTDDINDPRFVKLAGPIFTAMNDHAEKAGFELYFSGGLDEPDVHPKQIHHFYACCRLLRGLGMKIYSNNSVAGGRHFSKMLDFNIAAAYNGVIQAWEGRSYKNFFFDKEMGECPADYTRTHAKYVYTQIRSVEPTSARAHFGFLADAMDLRLMSGFAYYWGTSNWRIAYPFVEPDGRFGTTVGWEMTHAGIQDSRYLLTLKTLAKEKGCFVGFALPTVLELGRMDMAELTYLRNKIIDRILELQKI